MRTLVGIASHVDHPFVGRVERLDHSAGRPARAFVIAHGETHADTELRAVGCTPQSEARRTIDNIEHLELLRERDVVEVHPSGHVIILLSSRSNDNRILLTDRCNCNCIICPQVPPHATESRLALNRAILDFVAPSTETIVITGGEPTTVPEELIEVLALCKCRLPDCRVEILTNGAALEDNRIVRNIAAVGHDGLSFHVPLYSDSSSLHDTITGTRSFYRTLNGLLNLARCDQDIEIRTVVTALNYERLPQLAYFIARNLPFTSHVAFMGLEPIGRAMDNISRVWIEPGETLESLSSALHVLRRAGIASSIYGYQFCVLPERLWQYSRRAISDWKNSFLPVCTSCGLVATCGGFFESQVSHYSRLVRPIRVGGAE